jgi:cyclophilin family peptidyl-prolyl cis-trans isomerase
MKTTLGDISIILYDDTPLHKDNFIRLVTTQFYEGVSFHRVIKDFMIQTGDPATKAGLSPGLKDSLSNYTIEAEFRSHYFHKKGALAAARQGNEINPEMRSSGTQFYIVQGTKYNDEELNRAESVTSSNIKQSLFISFLKQAGDSLRMVKSNPGEAEIHEAASIKMFQYLTSNPAYKLSEDKRAIYKNTGGVPRLDGTYTVFGEVTEGLDVVDKIAAVPTDNNDKPITDIKILKIKINSK